MVGGYASEQLTHGWDLAVATGRPAEAETDLAVLADAPSRAVPDPPPRGGSVPFGPAGQPGPDVGPTDRLGADLGRSPVLS